LSKETQKVAKAENVLTLCSDALRITIRAASGRLKSKTVKAIIEHVTQLLPVATGEYCSGLSQFYLKVLGTVLEHEAYVELLEQDDWLSTVDFCLQGIRKYGSDTNSAASPHTLSRVTSTNLPYAQSSTSKLSLRSAGNPDSTNSMAKKSSEELLQCLLCLISASNAPVLERADGILHGIIHFLRNHGSIIGSIHQVAFSALNIVLSATSADRTSLSLSATPDIVRIIGHLWSSKTLAKDEMLNSAKDEMLITILLLRLHMKRLFRDKEISGFQNKIEDLEAVLRNEYAKRLDRDQLQLEDLDMSTLSNDVPGTTFINFGILRLRSHAPRAERNWATLRVLSILDALLHSNHEGSLSRVDMDEDEDDASSHPRKRRRISHRFDAIVKRIQSQDDGERLVALQTLLVMLPESKFSAQSLDDLLNQLVPCISDKRRHISSWAMLCISR
jgi:serine-protein kinase ATM